MQFPKPCEVCGEPATCGVRDIEEVPPSLSDMRQHYRPAGEPHYFCDAHRRDSQTFCYGPLALMNLPLD